MNIILFENGRSDWFIAEKTEASCVIKYAITEFVRYFAGITGFTLPISSEECQKNVISIGWEYAAALGEDGFIIDIQTEKIIISGSSPRGALYGVYTFFEHYLGCRKFSSDVEKIPKKDIIKLPVEIRSEKPVFIYRESFFTDALKGEFAAFNKCNGSSCSLEEHQGGKISYNGFVHTFFPLVPPSEYFEKHPEYYSEINGIRSCENTQLCLTNPEVLQIVIKKVKEGFINNPNAKIASVSQNDWYNFCQCEKCRAIDEEEGSHAGTLLRFVNAVADAIYDEFPDRYIDTLAYQYTRKPPEITKPSKNVLIRLCSIECCFAHSLEECTCRQSDGTLRNGAFSDDLKAWSKIAENLFVWDYVVDFAHYLMPFPNLRVLKDNINFFARHNVKGLFEQGCYNTEHGEMSELKGYVIAKLLWDPSYDVDLAVNEFLTGFYGMAAAPIRKYLDIQSDSLKENSEKSLHYGIFDPPKPELFTDGFLKEATILFDRAEVFADNPEIIKRVQTARLALRYVQIYLGNTSSEERREAIDNYFEDVAKLGLTRVSEWNDLQGSKNELLKRFGL